MKELLAAEGITVQSFNADLLYEPWEVLDDDGCPFTMFAPFWNRCLCMPDPAAPLLPPKRINSGIKTPHLQGYNGYFSTDSWISITDVKMLSMCRTLQVTCQCAHQTS